MLPLEPKYLIAAYSAGWFPMGNGEDPEQVEWYGAERRGVIPLDGFHAARSLIRRKRRGGLRFSCNEAFAEVMERCADRPEVWITPPIKRIFTEMHGLGMAHSVEVWEEGALAGCTYGLAIGGAFFAESMASPRRDGSKLALAELVTRLSRAGYKLLDTQFLTPHLASLGGKELPQASYLARLDTALACTPLRAFDSADTPDGALWQPESSGARP